MTAAPDTVAAVEAAIRAIAGHLLGEPNDALSTPAQLRFGTDGSVAVELSGDKIGQWYDHERKSGGELWEKLRADRGGVDDAQLHVWIKDNLGVEIAVPTPPNPWTAALRYAALGCPVFPLHYPVAIGVSWRCSCGDIACRNAAKHPVARHAPRGLLSATTRSDWINSWWGDGNAYNVGLVTGLAAGIFVLDIDPRHGGDVTLVALERKHGALPVTPRFRTGGGGEHIVFRHPGDWLVPNKAGLAAEIGGGIDVRGDGGYIVAPPSRHLSGKYYEVMLDPTIGGTAIAPDWLLDRLRRAAAANGRAAAHPAEFWQKLVEEGVDQGRRNDATARLAGHLFYHHVDPDVVFGLLTCWSECRCRPPLDEDELRRTINSILGKELTRREAKHGR